MNGEPNPHHIPTWKFVVALVAVLVAVTLGTLFTMSRENKPRRRPPLLGAPEAVATNVSVTNTASTNPPAAR